MPDITMCNGGECTAKDICYRYRAKPTPYYQSVFVTPPGKDESCVHYWSITTESPKRLQTLEEANNREIRYAEARRKYEEQPDQDATPE